MDQIDAAMGAVLGGLVRGLHARRVLEIGTGTGEAALCVAGALPANGMLITLERDEARARRARDRFEHAGVGARVAVMIGDARRYLHKIAGPFDLVVQQVQSGERRSMQPRLLELLREGGVLVTAIDTPDGEVALTVKR